LNEEAQGEVARGARALVVYPQMRNNREVDSESRLEEGKGLALAIGLVVADAFIIPIREPRAATLFGEGQIQNIATACSVTSGVANEFAFGSVIRTNGR